MILKLFSETLHFEMIFNLCEVILLNEWSFDTVHTGCKATIDLVQPMVQPNTVYTVFDNRNVSNTFGGHWMQIYFALACMRSTDTRNSVLSCLNMSNAHFFFFSESDFGWQQD